MVDRLLPRPVPLPSTLGLPGLRLLRENAHLSSSAALVYSEKVPDEDASTTGSTWLIPGVGALCFFSLRMEKFMSHLLHASLRLKEAAASSTQPEQLSAVAEVLIFVRKSLGSGPPLQLPPEVSRLFSQDAFTARASVLELVIHAANLGGTSMYVDAVPQVSQRVSSAWRTVASTAETAARTLSRVGDSASADAALAMAEEAMSHACGAAAEAAFRRGNFGVAQQLAAAALERRQGCPIANHRFEAFELVVQSHNLGSQPALLEAALLDALPSAVALGPALRV